MNITVIGGGSFTWAFGFLRQFVRSKRLHGAQIALMDINREALELVAAAGRTYNVAHGSPVRIEATMDFDRALDGADYVLVTISTGGLDSMQYDLTIPEKYRIWHTVGDTTGPGSWSRAARNIPVFRDLARRMTERCPEAWLINLSNPLTVLTRTPDKEFGVKAIGMCPGVEGQARMLSNLAGAREDACVEYTCVGVDHASWFTRLHADGMDVLQRLRDTGYWWREGQPELVALADDPMAGPSGNVVNFALWRQYGYMPTVPDRHTVENHPSFIVNEDGTLGYGLHRTTVAERRAAARRRKDELEAYVKTGNEADFGKMGHGDDPVLQVIESLSGHRSFLWGSNYRNMGQMRGAPEDAVVETRCLFDSAGVHPLCSPLPEVLKPLLMPMIHRQEAVLDVVLRGRFDEFVALVASDPLCCRLSPGRCREMMKELLLATREWIQNPKLLKF